MYFWFKLLNSSAASFHAEEVGYQASPLHRGGTGLRVCGWVGGWVGVCAYRQEDRHICSGQSVKIMHIQYVGNVTKVLLSIAQITSR